MTRDAEPAAPRAALVVADSVRVLGTLSILVSAVWLGPVEVALFLLVLLGLLVPRMLALPVGLDLALGVTLLAGGWFAVFDVFEAIGPLDLVVHCVANGLLAVSEVFGTDLPQVAVFRDTVTDHLKSLLENGAKDAVRRIT